MKAITPELKTSLGQRLLSSFILVALAFGFSALSQIAQAVSPSPDGGYAGGNTAEGQSALFNLTTGVYNTALGLFSLKSNSTGNFNTATGAGALFATTADENTATGAAALFSNTTGEANLANGAFALFNNTDGSDNTANGLEALFTNRIGRGNTATGAQALFPMMVILITTRDLITQPLEPMRSSATPPATATAPSARERWT